MGRNPNYWRCQKPCSLTNKVASLENCESLTQLFQIVNYRP